MLPQPGSGGTTHCQSLSQGCCFAVSFPPGVITTRCVSIFIRCSLSKPRSHRGSCTPSAGAAQPGVGWDGRSVPQTAVHTLQTHVPPLAMGQETCNLSRTCVWVSTHGSTGHDGPAGPNSASDAAAQATVFGSKLWKRQLGSQFPWC